VLATGLLVLLAKAVPHEWPGISINVVFSREPVNIRAQVKHGRCACLFDWARSRRDGMADQCRRGFF